MMLTDKIVYLAKKSNSI